MHGNYFFLASQKRITQENAKCVNYKFASLSQKRKAFNANSEFVYARPELYEASILWLQPSKTFKIPDK